MATTVGLRGRKKDNLRRALFSNALRLFEERGFAATSIDDIAASVDVSRRTFFRYFASKEDVVVVDRERKIAIVDEALKGRGQYESVPAAVGRALQELARYYGSEVDVVRALYRLGRSEPAIAGRLLEHHADWQQAVARSVAVALETDATRDIRPHVIAATALAAARLALARWVADGCKGSPGESIGRLYATSLPALEMLTGPSSAPTDDSV